MEKIFEINLLMASVYGMLLGFFNGFICYVFLKRYINAESKKFFTTYVITFFYKLLFLVASILLLRHKKVIIILGYCFFLIFVQVIFELVSVKKYGNKRNT
jgi:hypothetical protein